MIGKLKKYTADSSYRFLVNSSLGLYRTMDDEKFLKRVYYARTGKTLNLENPKTFNEKLQWLKLHDRNPRYSVMADKAAVKDYVRKLIGQKYIIPTLGVYDSFEDIDFDKLPERFVLKCTHDSGGLVICSDRSAFNKRKAKRVLSKFLKRDYFLQWREYPYKDIPKKIIAEEFLSPDKNGLTDYKVHCFNGEPRLILVCSERFSEKGLTEDFYTESWEHLDIKRPGVPQAAEHADKPVQLDEMLSLARVLSKGIPFVRIDFYIVNNSVLFSEFTFYPASGLTNFEPCEWDKTIGDWLTLPGINMQYKPSE